MDKINTNWWKNSIGYQIYIKSFYDSNNDGIGDLNGITEKLDYIKNLGVDFIWICPFYDSPMDDNGYDIRNYFKVSEIFGNINDLKNLIKEAHSRNIKVVIDLVLNHTSDEHEWFIKSENKIEPYTDFYIWKDGVEKNKKLYPPNNWTSFFSGPAWKYSEKRKQYFLKIFSNKMPDINYENSNVFIEIEKIIEFYSKLNIDGFRVDAIAHIGKELSFSNVKNAKTSYKSFSNLKNTHKYLKILNKVFKKYNLVTLCELGVNPSKEDVLKYTTEDELDMVFTFEQINIFTKRNTINKVKLLKTLMYKNSIIENNGWAVLFWLNHDYPRLISKIKGEGDPKNVQICLAILMYFLKGTPLIYNGEEIGMTNYPFSSPEDFLDVNARMIIENSKNKELAFYELKENTRDNSRTVMQWTNDEYAGFSNSTPWTYVNSNKKYINVEQQYNDNNSMLLNYKKIISTRKLLNKIINFGNYEFFKKDGIIGYKINYQNECILVLANFSKSKKIIKESYKEILYSNNCFFNDKTIIPYGAIILKI